MLDCVCATVLALREAFLNWPPFCQPGLESEDSPATAVLVEPANGAMSNGHIQEASTPNNSVSTSANGNVTADPASKSNNAVRPIADVLLLIETCCTQCSPIG